MKEIIVSEENQNQRLDKFLKRILPEASMSFIFKMLRKKNITLNGKKATGSEKLVCDDLVKIFFSDETFAIMSGSNIKDPYYETLSNGACNIDVVYEDADMIIINKPAGILSQKANDDDFSINEMALSYMINKGELSEDEYKSFHPSIVNRLDRNTSGIIIFAKNLQASQKLSAEIKDRAAKKIYHAIVLGHVKKPELIDGYLFKDEKSNMVTITKEYVKDSKEIKTEYTPIKYLGDDLTLLSIHLITGRTHQIRAHLSSIGHPILGDFKYGNQSANKKYKAKRQMLHAYSIEFSNGNKYIAKEPEDINVYF